MIDETIHFTTRRVSKTENNQYVVKAHIIVCGDYNKELLSRKTIHVI